MALTDTAFHVLDAAEACAAADAEVGGKARGLARLVELLDGTTARVPPFRVLPASAFRAHLRHPEVRARLGEAFLDLAEIEVSDAHSTAGIADCSRALVDAVLAADVDGAVADAVAAALADLEPGPWAVRSSMVGEDSATQSFAGQLDSFLFLPDAASVIDAIRRCWASAFSERALVYGLRSGLSPMATRMAVVVQRMVDADASGVIFTVNPLTGDRSEVLITAAWGQGEGIVSGLCDTDEYVFVAGEGERRATVADKDVQVRAEPAGVGTTAVPVPAEQRRARVLSARDVEELGRVASEVAASLGTPQDLEFCYEHGSLHLLQTRPITALSAPATTEGPRALWDNSNIQESYCGVTTPLTFSFASHAYAIVYDTFFRVAGTPERVLRANRDRFANLLGLLDGRVYYNLNNWYEACLLLPSPGHTKDDMENMMGVDEPVDFVIDEDATLGSRLATAASLAPVIARLLPQLLTIERRIDRFRRHFRSVLDSIDRDAFATMSFPELMDVVRRLDRELLEQWDVPILNDLRVLRGTGGVRRFLAGALDLDVRADEVNRLCSDLLGGIDGIESIEPTRMLLRMAGSARSAPGVADALREGSASDALAAIRAQHPTFAALIDEYINRYGDRVMGELKLETVSLREDARFVVEVLRNYLDRPDLDAEHLARREHEHYQATYDAVSARLDRRARGSFARRVTACREAVKAREGLRLERTRLFGLYRDVYVAVGRRLHEVGRLDHPRDIFWLTIDEITAYNEGRSVTKDLAAIARVRAAEFEQFRRVDLPHRIETIGPVYHGNTLTRPDPDPAALAVDVLSGTGCYPGVVETAVRVVHSPADELSVNGRILVTVRTDPGWAPLFPTCSGLLVERGSTLSHSAVVARELGIPAVVGIRGLTQVLDDGEVVRMDGGAGTVQRLDRTIEREAVR